MSDITVMDMVTTALEEHGDDVRSAILVIQSGDSLFVHATTTERSRKVGMLEVAKDITLHGGDPE